MTLDLYTCSDMSAVKGSLPFFRKSLEKIHSTRKCPLCTRGFSDHAGFEKTVKSVCPSHPCPLSILLLSSLKPGSQYDARPSFSFVLCVLSYYIFRFVALGTI